MGPHIHTWPSGWHTATFSLKLRTAIWRKRSKIASACLEGVREIWSGEHLQWTTSLSSTECATANEVVWRLPHFWSHETSKKRDDSFLPYFSYGVGNVCPYIYTFFASVLREIFTSPFLNGFPSERANIIRLLLWEFETVFILPFLKRRLQAFRKHDSLSRHMHISLFNFAEKGRK